MAVGCALGAFENALDYSRQRQQFGRPIAGFQLVQDLLVRMLGNITASATLCTQLSGLQDAGQATDAQRCGDVPVHPELERGPPAEPGGIVVDLDGARLGATRSVALRSVVIPG